MFDLIKYKIYAVMALIGAGFLGYLKYLQVSNKSKKDKIDQLNKQAEVAKNISDIEIKKAEYKGFEDVTDKQVREAEANTDRAYKERGNVKTSGTITTILI